MGSEGVMHVAVYPGPGMGHFLPFCELSKRLARDFNFKVTLVLFQSFSTSTHAAPFLSALPNNVHVHYIPNVDVGSQVTNTETQIALMVENSASSVQDFFRSCIKSHDPVSIFLIDFFASNMISMAADLSIPSYVFITSSIAFLSVMYFVPKLVSQISASFDEVEFGIQLPGLPVIPGNAMPSPLWYRSLYGFEYYAKVCSLFTEASGILINSFEQLETRGLSELVRVGNGILPKVYPMGPLVRETQPVADTSMMKWLDDQPPSSVVFISFGSGVALGDDQVAELAHGLEMSGHRFMWVLRKKMGEHSSSTYFSIPSTEIDELLPSGFRERTANRGIVVPSWAPQIDILEHPSTGVFVTHCGWNSILESIWCGVPVLPWPMFAEQLMNRIMLLQEYGTCVDLKVDKHGFVKKEEIQVKIKEIMEGEEGKRARDRAKELKNVARNAMAKGGASQRALIEVVEEWKGANFKGIL